MELNVRDWLIILGSLVAAGFVLDAYRRVRAGYSDKLRLSARQQRDEEDELSNPELPAGGARVIPRTKAVPSYEKARQADEQSDSVPVLMDSMDDEAPAEQITPADESPPVSAAEALGELAHEPGTELVREPSPARASEKADKSTTSSGAADTSRKDPEEIIVLHVVAPDGEQIEGPALLQILLACDVRYGHMNIFHRYEEAGGAGAEQFSVVNMVAPGTFDLDDMDNFASPGVIFFMRLPGPKQAIKAFDCMVETAQCLVKNLGCELHDEAHSAVTPQTLQHLRQRIRDFERRQLTLV